MNTQKTSEGEIKITGGRKERKHKYVIYRGLDFNKVEVAPKSDLERDVQKELASVPSPAEILIEEETKNLERKLFKEALEKTSLSEMERTCIDLSLDGKGPVDIGKLLNIHYTSVRNYLKRAASKIKANIDFRQFE